jgi:hypothetical protein
LPGLIRVRTPRVPHLYPMSARRGVSERSGTSR